MTAIIFIGAIGLAWIHWTYAEVGWLAFGNVTIYVAAFVATLASASLAALLSRDSRCILAALVLILNFTASHYAWQTENPILFDSLNNLAAAAWFVLTGKQRWEFLIGGALLLAVVSGILSAAGIIPNHLHRDNARFIAWSYPDIVALLGHAANVTLGWGSGDAGKLVRIPLQVRVLGSSLGWRFVSRVAALAKVARD